MKFKYSSALSASVGCDADRMRTQFLTAAAT